LHANADLTFRLKESLEMINTLTETRPKESNTGGGQTREEMVFLLLYIKRFKIKPEKS
jgi:dynein heavy chain